MISTVPVAVMRGHFPCVMKIEIIQQFQDFMNVTQLSLDRLYFEIKSFRVETLSTRHQEGSTGHKAAVQWSIGCTVYLPLL